MRKTMERLRGGVFGLAVAGVLAFGGSQALAAPAPEQGPPTCDPAVCSRICKALFGPFAGGFCPQGPNGPCECAF